MKNLILLSALFIGISAKAQTNIAKNADGEKTGYTIKLNNPITTITSQVNFEYPPGMKAEPIPAKKGANDKTYILVANESFPGVGKFEIDIFSGHKKLDKATRLVWLSVTSANKQLLSNGTYKYSDKGPADRGAYKFAGSVNVNGVDEPIVAGTFQVNTWDKRIVINYNLTLKNGVKTTGAYDTNFEVEDRSVKKENGGIRFSQQ